MRVILQICDPPWQVYDALPAKEQRAFGRSWKRLEVDKALVVIVDEPDEPRPGPAPAAGERRA